jgi:hypothetical protein
VAGTPDTGNDESNAAPGRRSIVGTWIEVAADAGGLIRAEAGLARAETRANLQAVGREYAKLGAGAVLLSMALVFLTVATVVALAHFIGLLPALLVVALVCVVAGALLLRAGGTAVSRLPILPERTLGRMSRDLDNLAARASPLAPLAPEDAPEAERRAHEAT